MKLRLGHGSGSFQNGCVTAVLARDQPGEAFDLRLDVGSGIGRGEAVLAGILG